jgi:hypothetical protein
MQLCGHFVLGWSVAVAQLYAPAPAAIGLILDSAYQKM